MNNEYDVIIIGAGPGGLECVKQLKDSNLSVLLIEKNEIIGPKICAGGLTNLTNDYNIPENKTRSFGKQKIFINDREYEITLTNPIKTITRLELGQYQLQQIRNCKNITIITHTSVKQITKNQIITSDGKNFYFKLLVGADGSNSIVRKHLGLKSKYCIGLYYDIPKVTDDFIWYVNPKQLKSGYIWVFPHKNHTNIGVYFNPKSINPKEAKNILENYIKKNGYEFSLKDIKGSPINYKHEGCIFKNIFLVGDAAGLASKTTGEGISFALTSGKEMAKKILNPNYKTTELNKILKIKRRQERMLEKFENFPLLQNLFYKIFVNLMKREWFQIYFGN